MAELARARCDCHDVVKSVIAELQLARLVLADWVLAEFTVAFGAQVESLP
jgi:hypothetical protein